MLVQGIKSRPVYRGIAVDPKSLSIHELEVITRRFIDGLHDVMSPEDRLHLLGQRMGGLQDSPSFQGESAGEHAFRAVGWKITLSKR